MQDTCLLAPRSPVLETPLGEGGPNYVDNYSSPATLSSTTIWALLFPEKKRKENLGLRDGQNLRGGAGAAGGGGVLGGSGGGGVAVAVVWAAAVAALAAAAAGGRRALVVARAGGRWRNMCSM